MAYAASDVLHLHALKEKLDVLLAREGRTDLAEACFRFLPDRARLDLLGWAGRGHFRSFVTPGRRAWAIFFGDFQFAWG